MRTYQVVLRHTGRSPGGVPERREFTVRADSEADAILAARQELRSKQTITTKITSARAVPITKD